MKIDLNADLGEGMGNDEAIMRYVSSCNIACGGHAGDEASMRRALTSAAAAGVACGAHPSYPDRPGFGREPYRGSRQTLAASLSEQMANLLQVAAELGVKLTHVKPHGALYNDAVRDEDLAKMFVREVAELLPETTVVGAPSSCLAIEASKSGLEFLPEGFADRRYLSDGQLLPRMIDGAVLHDPEEQVAQALQIVRGEPVQTHGGARFMLSAGTISLHGDTPGAVLAAEHIRKALEASGVVVEAPYA